MVFDVRRRACAIVYVGAEHTRDKKGGLRSRRRLSHRLREGQVQILFIFYLF